MTLNCTECPPSRCIIKNASEQLLELLNKKKSIFRCKKEEYIFREGTPVNGIYVIFSGKVKVFNTGYNEKIQVVRLASDGHILGHRGLGNKYYTISAVALENSVLCFIPMETFALLLKMDGDVSYQLMVFYAEELRNAEARMKNLGQMTVREKVTEALLLIKKTFGVNKEEKILLDVELARKDIAEIAGIRTDQTIKTLSEFVKEGIISFSGKKIILNKPDDLYEFIAPYYPSDFLHKSSDYFSQN